MHKRVSILQKLLVSMKKIPTPEVHRLLHSSLHFVMIYSYNHGLRYTPDTVFMAVGFSINDTKESQTKIKTAGISGQNKKRCACLTGQYHIDYRNERHAAISNKIGRKSDKNKARLTGKKLRTKLWLTICTAWINCIQCCIMYVVPLQKAQGP